MIGQPRFDHHAAAVAKGGGDLARFGVVFDFLALLGSGDVRDEVSVRFQPGDHQFARAVHAIPLETVQADEFLWHQTIGDLTDIRLGIEHVEHFTRCKPGALAHFEIVEVVARRDLHRTAAQFRVGVFVRDDGDAPPGDRQDHVFAHDAGIAIIGRMHRHRHIREHRFGPRGRDFDVIAPIRQCHTVCQRIFEVPELPRNRLSLDLKVGYRGLQLGIPVHQPLVAIDQPVVIQIDETSWSPPW